MSDQAEIDAVSTVDHGFAAGFLGELTEGVPAAVPMVSATVLSAPTYPLTKRAFDVVASMVLLVLALPVVIVIAIAVRIQGGPVFFKQERVGTGGQRIWIRKFRTMTPDAESRLRADQVLYERYLANGFKLPAEDDPRITRFGRFLRASSLDELPQLWSVLHGTMAMVGPRPVVPPELAEYRSRGAEQAYLDSRPGLTGLWQVSGRSNLGYDQRIALDLEYLDDPTVLNDVRILARSVPAVIRRVGAH
jgi:lipopolysaccharide/colanic/teichoic acid biosynthesis glycosyltransferase